MARVIASEVKEIIDTDLTNRNIDTFIGAANRLVTDILGSDTTLSDDQKKDIEQYLTAHFIASTVERQAMKEKAMDASIEYSGKTGKYLDGTTYGQMVKMLDTTGKLADSVGKKRASITAVTSFDEV